MNDLYRTCLRKGTNMTTGLQTGTDGIIRCSWPGRHVDYTAYHDYEWGYPVDDDRSLFEKICLEGFQAGLSWLTILRKRDHLRKAFADFDPAIVIRFERREIEKLLEDSTIIRHQGKIESTINNAARCLELMEEFGSLATYIWSWEPSQTTRVSSDSLPTFTPTSAALSRDLKARGWSFVGPTTIYAFMQAVGLVNDHLSGCFAHPKVEVSRKNLIRP